MNVLCKNILFDKKHPVGQRVNALLLLLLWRQSWTMISVLVPTSAPTTSTLKAHGAGRHLVTLWPSPTGIQLVNQRQERLRTVWEFVITSGTIITALKCSMLYANSIDRNCYSTCEGCKWRWRSNCNRSHWVLLVLLKEHIQFLCCSMFLFLTKQCKRYRSN